MAVPKKRTTKSKRNMRRSHHGINIALTNCPKCKKKVSPHTACSFCGYYASKQVIEIKTKQKKEKGQPRTEQPKVEKEAKK